MFHFRPLSKSVATMEDMENFDKAAEKLGVTIPHFFPKRHYHSKIRHHRNALWILINSTNLVTEINLNLFLNQFL